MRSYEQVLACFIRRVDVRQDTPDLIMIIAADADHLWACRSIVDPAAPLNAVPSILQRICDQNGWRLSDLREKLTPAAEALGIIPTANASDHYQVLGVRKKATAHEIKRAFRSRAFSVHPDTSAEPSGSNEPFHDLMDAYRTLKDPDIKGFYDAKRQPQWREYPTRFLLADGRASVYRWYLGGLMVIFIALLLLTIITN